jgi:hypothetical protein
MLAILFYGGIIISFIIIWLEYKCAISNKRFYKITQSTKWKRLYKWRYLIAFILVPILFPGYHIVVDSESFHIIGFPLMAAVFDSRGTDFVSAFTGIFLFIDALILYFSIHVFICIAQRWVEKDDEQ